jgi:hypothetical protein
LIHDGRISNMLSPGGHRRRRRAVIIKKKAYRRVSRAKMPSRSGVPSDTDARYLPTPDDIERATADIRRAWNRSTERSRRAVDGDAVRWTVPVIRELWDAVYESNDGI